MAGGVGIAPSGGKAYPGKLTANVVFTCIAAACGGLIFGYDLGISGGVTSMPSFLKKFFPDVYRKQERHSDTNQYCKFNSEKLTLFTSSLYIAALVASWLASFTTRKLGRRPSMMFGGVLFFVGAFVNAFAQNLAMLYIGRALLGAGIGFANQSVPVYLSEVAPYRYRGALNMGFQLLITVGILAANVLNYFVAKSWPENGWRYSLGGAAVPGVIFFALAMFLKDSPNSLIERGETEKAKERLQKIRGLDDVDAEFEDLIAASEESKKVKHPWANILKRRNRPQLTFAVLIPFFQQFTGMNVITFYAPVLFKTIGFGDRASLMSAVITNCVNCAATLIAISIVDRFGRKKLFIEGGIQMLICQLLIAGFIGERFGIKGNPGVLPSWYANTLVTFICIYVAGFAWSWGPLGWLVPSEIFPLEVRSAGQTINVSVNMFFTFVIAQIFTEMLCKFKFGLFLFFAVFVAAMVLFIYKLFPETKGIPIEEMAVVWSKHSYWKKFVPPQEDDAGVKLPSGYGIVLEGKDRKSVGDV